MKPTHRIIGILLLTPALIGAILFLTQTSVDPRWGGGYWERWLSIHLSITPGLSHEIIFWIRKTIHFLSYGMLGLLFWLYFYLWRVKKPIIWGIIAAILVASYDEYTQSLSSFRSGRIEDVILDSCGIMITSWIVKGLQGKLLKKIPFLRFLTKIE